jgi:PKD repeat protein
MANPSWRAAGTKTDGDTVTTISVPPPAGHQAGDLLVLFTNSWASPSGTTVSTPAGWTALGGNSGAWGLNARYRTYVFYKLAASSSEPNVSVVQAATGFPEGVIYAYKDVHPTTPIDATGGWGAQGSAVTLFPAPAVTTVANNALVAYLGAWSNSVTDGAPPNSATQNYKSSFITTVSRESDVLKATAGTVPAGNWTLLSSSTGLVFAFAVKAAPTAAPPVADFTGTPTGGSATLAVAFTDASTNTPTGWAWDFGDGSTSSSQNPSHSYTSSGVYTVSLTATNASGSDTKTRTAYITVSEPIVYASGGGIDVW